MKCADCGVTVENHRGRWVHRSATQDGKATRLMCCRVVMDPNDPYRMLAADYHYVDGEFQQHVDVCGHCGTVRDITRLGQRRYHTKHADEQRLVTCRAVGHDMRNL